LNDFWSYHFELLCLKRLSIFLRMMSIIYASLDALKPELIGQPGNSFKFSSSAALFFCNYQKSPLTNQFMKNSEAWTRNSDRPQSTVVIVLCYHAANCFWLVDILSGKRLHHGITSINQIEVETRSPRLPNGLLCHYDDASRDWTYRDYTPD
jgi:hypothetical protein